MRSTFRLSLLITIEVVDGAGAVGFLKHVKECIEDPQRLMLGV